MSADVSTDLINNEHSNMPTSDLKSVDAEITNIERPVTPVPELGENVEIGSNDDIAVLVNKCKDQADELCYTWSEVKLYRLTNSELEKYLGKVNQDESTNNCSKGDNSDNTPQSDVSNIPLHPTYSRSGRPLHKTANKSIYVESDNGESDISDDVLKVGNRVNLSKPSSSWPSAEQIAAQNKRTVSPVFGIKPNKVYKHPSSPSYSVSSSGLSTYRPEQSDSDLEATFDGFEPLPEEDRNKLAKIGKLRTVEYELKKRKWIRSYICHEGGCTFFGKSIREFKEHHVKSHQDVVCKKCNKSFKTPSSLQWYSYSHGDLWFPCNQCEDAFTFKSELNFHKMVHQTIPTFKCMSKNCGKMYKSSNELKKHVLKHSGMIWDCDAKNCEYSTDDRRNLRAHKKKHLEIRGFKCKPCVKYFKYFMQLKRHKKKPEMQSQKG